MNACAARYAERLDQDPQSADAAYLLARAEPVRRGGAPFAALTARFPKHIYTLRAHLYDRVIAGDYAAAVEAAKLLRELDFAAYHGSIVLVAEAMVAVGAVDEALAAIEQVFPSASGVDEQLGLAALHALVAQHSSTPENRGALFVKVAQPTTPHDTANWLAARRFARLPVTSGELKLAGEEASRTSLDIMGALETSPGKAVTLADTATEPALSALPPSAWALAYCEAARTNPQGKAAMRLGRTARAQARVLSEFIETGDEDALLELEPSVRAAARVVRARDPQVGPVTRQALLSVAAQEDILKTVVSAAIENWQ